MKEIRKYLENSDCTIKSKAVEKALLFLVSDVQTDVTLLDIRRAVNKDAEFDRMLGSVLQKMPETDVAVCFVMKHLPELRAEVIFSFLTAAYARQAPHLQIKIMQVLRSLALDNKYKIKLLLRNINSQFAAYIKELLNTVNYEVFHQIRAALEFRSDRKELLIDMQCLDILEYFINMESRLFCPIALIHLVPVLIERDKDVFAEGCCERSSQIVLQMFEKYPKAVSLVSDCLWVCLLKNQFSETGVKNYQLLVYLLLYTWLDKKVVTELPNYLEILSSYEGEINKGWQSVQMAFTQRLENDAKDIGEVCRIVGNYILRLRECENGQPENFYDAVPGLQLALPYYCKLVKMYSANILQNPEADDDIYKENAFSMFVDQLFWLGKLTGNAGFTALVKAALDEMLKQYQVTCYLPWAVNIQDIVSILDNVLFEQNQEQLDYVVKMLTIIAEAYPYMFEDVADAQVFSDFCEEHGIIVSLFEERHRERFERLRQRNAENAKLLQELENL